MTAYSLFELNLHVRQVVALNFPDSLWVTAEVAQIKESRGHHYLELLQKEGEEVIAQCPAMIWETVYRQLKRKLGEPTLEAILQAGMQLLMKVKVEFHERYGLKITIEDIDDTYTEGQMAMQRRKNLLTLYDLGLLEKNAKLPLPMVLQRLAVITSERAAGFQDFFKHLKTNQFGYFFDLKIFSAAVQGVNVEREFCAHLETIAAQKNQFDAVVIIRGGGAKLDLAAFDSFILCKAVANFPLPVLVGIGHETDETLLDIVSHKALKTPTAVANFLIDRSMEYESQMVGMAQYISRQSLQIIQENQNILNLSFQQIRSKSNGLIQYLQQNMENIAQNTATYWKNKIKNENNSLDNLEKITQILSPDAALKRGFSMTMLNGKPIISVQNVQKNDILNTVFQDGSLESTVTKINQ